MNFLSIKKKEGGGGSSAGKSFDELDYKCPGFDFYHLRGSESLKWGTICTFILIFFKALENYMYERFHVSVVLIAAKGHFLFLSFFCVIRSEIFYCACKYSISLTIGTIY